MSAAYDAYAEPYQRSKLIDCRVYGETPNHMRILGDLRGRSVIDLACGEGFYTRLIKRAGAEKVLGVDVSSEMVALARKSEEAEPLGIEYVVSPVESMGPLGRFDVASAAFLLNNAVTVEVLATMCRAIAGNLAPGGRLVATNSQFSEYPGVDFARYGMTSDCESNPADGSPYRLDFRLGEDRFTLINYHYCRSTYERALRSAGFDSIRWHPLTITHEGIAKLGEEFWRVALESPPIVVIEAVKE